ncbi:MAG: cation transporter [Halodesulfurarchaeum sp.]|nr:cation transporter [Halodesulfurarchaeum sp.]
MANHDHGAEPTSTDQSVRKLGLVAAINLVGFVIELIGGLVFGSVALLGDAFHMLFDALANVIAPGATVIARFRIRVVGGPTVYIESNRLPRF